MPVSLLKMILAEPEPAKEKPKGKTMLRKGNTLRFGKNAGLTGLAAVRRPSKQISTTSKQLSSSKAGRTSFSGTGAESINTETEEESKSPLNATTTMRSGVSSQSPEVNKTLSSIHSLEGDKSPELTKRNSIGSGQKEMEKLSIDAKESPRSPTINRSHTNKVTFSPKSKETSATP